MAHVIDLATDDGGADLLDRTDADGLFGPGHLCSEPLASRLADDETARYLLRNKKAGATIADGGRERHLEPDADYQAFVVVTDRRLLFVAGTAAGDTTFTLPLADVLDVEAESAGIRSSRLAVETADGRRVTFPCRGDLGDVVEAIADDAAVWSHSERRFEAADEALERARDRLADGDHEAALAALEEATAAWEAAVDGVAAVHEDAAAWMRERVDEIRPAAARLRRRARAQAGVRAHAAAQAAWAECEYEEAAAAYERAVEASRAALAEPGDEPSDGALDRRIRAAAGERAVLRVGPLVDADAARRRAGATDDVDAAADAWERALERYRETLELEWGEAGRSFAIDRDAVRERAAAAADAAIDARSEVADRWVTAGDALAATQDGEDATRLYDRAQRHLEAARDLAEEVQPERLEGLQRELAGISDRRAGRVEPPAEPPDGPMPVDSVADALEVLGDDVDFADEPPTPASAGGRPAAVAGAPPAGSGDEADSGAGGLERDDGGSGSDATSIDRARLAEGLRELTDAAFTELVAAVWAAKGWSTSVFATDAGTVYDVLGVRGEETLLLWAVRAPDGGTVGSAVVERCATTRDRSRGADRAALVTDGSVAAAAAERAADLDVEVVDRDVLCESIEEAGLVDRVV